MGRAREQRTRTPEASTAPARSRDATAIVPPTLAIVPQTGGQSLDAATQTDMTGRFGHNFAAVRVHTDARAAESAAALDARAFAVGRDITFGAGQYAPETGGGQRLLAHELTHVVQHDRAPLVPDSGVSRPGDAAEQEATATAAAVVDGGPLPAIAAAPVAAVQRDPTDPAAATPPPAAPPPAGAPPDGQAKAPAGDKPTFEFFNLAGVLASKSAIAGRTDALIAYAKTARETGDTVRSKIKASSLEYQIAYNNYANAIRGARQEAGNQNLYLGIAIGVAVNIAAAFVLPATAAGWFALTAAEGATALASGAVQAGVGAALGTALQFSGGDLEPGGLSPEAQQLGLWQTAAGLYRAAGTQSETVGNMQKIVAAAEFLTGEIRVQVAGGLATMPEDTVLDKVEVLLRIDRELAQGDEDIKARLVDLQTFAQRVNDLNTSGDARNEMEQNIWILWMGGLSDASVLDLDAIEDRLHAIKVLGPGSRLGIDFGWYTFFWEEDNARDAAKVESVNIKKKVSDSQLPPPPTGN